MRAVVLSWITCLRMLSRCFFICNSINPCLTVLTDVSLLLTLYGSFLVRVFNCWSRLSKYIFHVLSQSVSMVSILSLMHTEEYTAGDNMGCNEPLRNVKSWSTFLSSTMERISRIIRSLMRPSPLVRTPLTFSITKYLGRSAFITFR